MASVNRSIAAAPTVPYGCSLHQEQNGYLLVVYADDMLWGGAVRLELL